MVTDAITGEKYHSTREIIMYLFFAIVAIFIMLTIIGGFTGHPIF